MEMLFLSTVDRSLTEGENIEVSQWKNAVFKRREKSSFRYWTLLELHISQSTVKEPRFRTIRRQETRRTQTLPQLILTTGTGDCVIGELLFTFNVAILRSGDGASAAVCVRGETSGHPHRAPVCGPVRGASEGTNHQKMKQNAARKGKS